MDKKQHICQVAFSCLDGKSLKRWYQQGFGFVDAGGAVFGGPSTTRVQGLPGVWERCRWLIDSQSYFQLEFFQFWSPKSKFRPNNWNPADIGYNMLGLLVSDFDDCLQRLEALGSLPLSPPLGEPGLRSACVKDPEGNLVEILECDPLSSAPTPFRPEVPVTARRMTVSVPDIDRAEEAWVDGLGLSVLEARHDYQGARTALWRLPNAQAQRVLLDGGNFVVELLQYLKPEPKPRPEGYQICDQGFMNIAVGFRESVDFDRRLQQCQGKGFRPNGETLDVGMFRVMYVNDSDGFSVELLHARPALWSLSGFNPGVAYLEFEQWINAPKEVIWPIISDHNRLGEWVPYKGELIKPADGDDKNGVGAMRRLTGKGLPIVEEVVACSPGRSYSYRLISGAPMKNHRGDVILADERGGTRVRWSVQFQASLLTPILKWGMGLLFRKSLPRLKQLVENSGKKSDMKHWQSHYEHKTIFISGGSSGIGLAMAEQLAACGAHIVIFARNAERLREAEEAIANKVLSGAQNIASYSVDVGDNKALSASLADAVEKMGTPDVVITSAGMATAKAFSEQSYAEFKANIDINVMGTVGFIRGLYPNMAAKGGGQIAMIGSLAGLVPTWGYSSYCASKGALQSFADVLEMESLGEGFRVTLINPAEVATPMVAAEAASQSLPRATRFMKDMVGTANVDDMAISTLQSIAKKRRRVVFGSVRAKLVVMMNRYLPFFARHFTRVLLKLIH